MNLILIDIVEKGIRQEEIHVLKFPAEPLTNGIKNCKLCMVHVIAYGAM